METDSQNAPVVSKAEKDFSTIFDSFRFHYYTQSGQFESKIAEIDQLKLDRLAKTALLLYAAQYYYNKNRLEEAKDCIIKINKMKKTALSLYNKGKICYETGDYKQAIKCLRESIKMDPMDVRPKVYLGKAYYMAGINSRAIRSFEAALELDENNIEALFMLTQLKVQDRTEKRRILEKIIKLEPTYGSAYAELGGILFGNKEMEQSRDYLFQALALNKDYEWTYAYLFYVYKHTGKDELAKEVLELAEELFPNWNCLEILRRDVLLTRSQDTP